MKLLCSACLLGISCRYDAKSKPSKSVLALLKEHELVPVCPEQLGGLPTPRPACEMQENGRIFSVIGEDKSEQYQKGAAQAFKIYQLTGCEAALLKTRSPACGKNFIYDGTFTKTLKPGQGVFAELLEKNGIDIFTDEEDSLL